jgi:hypothetical protein
MSRAVASIKRKRRYGNTMSNATDDESRSNDCPNFGSSSRISLLDIRGGIAKNCEYL